MLYPLNGILHQILHAVWRRVLGGIDRWTDPPIMRQRVNGGSDKYFAWQRKHEGDSELDEFLDPENERADE